VSGRIFSPAGEFFGEYGKYFGHEQNTIADETSNMRRSTELLRNFLSPHIPVAGKSNYFYFIET
jgi:hypothetical protein